ncbi:MAG: sensor N-terminal transmembrane domain-containing protein, partial [Amylibacter sp.]
MANVDIDMASDMKLSDGHNFDSKQKVISIKRYFWSSALARRIIAFNLIALCVLLLGMLYLNQFRNSVAAGRLVALQSESTLYAQLLQERVLNDKSDVSSSNALLGAILKDLPLSKTSEIHVYDVNNNKLVSLEATVAYSDKTQNFGKARNFSYFWDG